ncbi:hypothetical protein ONE63_011198 [Megalurothrips usitatus]|uniref:Glucose dehydrogenase n=1 Tax=Megalurothrips usitatus TaxID=439358 RepID=A0AAV7X3X4_9NEOP|nr:hypothetical protein ONE63_011198 [Megalurothrips usitatus]
MSSSLAAKWPAGCANTPLVAFVSVVLAAVNSRLEAEQRRQASASAGPDTEFDFVVVGGGSAGCVLAERLSRDANTTVLLLERGGTEPPQARVPGYIAYMLMSNVMENLEVSSLHRAFRDSISIIFTAVAD